MTESNNNNPEQKEIDILAELVKENLKLTKEIHAMTKGIKSFVVWQRIFWVVKILIIAVPVVLGIIYLPPLLRELIGQYQNLLQLSENPMKGLLESGQDLNLPGIDIKSLLPSGQR